MTHTTVPHSRPSPRWRALATAMAIAVGVTVAVVAQHLDDGQGGDVRVNPGTTTAQATPRGLSAYAQAHGLSGLSPASLTRVDPSITTSGDLAAIIETYRDVARYAQVHDLSGLSPASLTPLAQRATAHDRAADGATRRDATGRR